MRRVTMKVKVCLVGEPAVGKTSIIRRYVEGRFDDAYLATLQAKFSKKETTLDVAERGLQVKMAMVLWDIMGDKGHRQLLKEAYFYGAQGILAVCDVTRRTTLDDLHAWWDAVTETVGKIPWVLVVNKMDLTGHLAFGEAKVRGLTERLGAPFFFTSAKTGKGIEDAFASLGRRIFDDRERM